MYINLLDNSISVKKILYTVKSKTFCHIAEAEVIIFMNAEPSYIFLVDVCEWSGYLKPR